MPARDPNLLLQWAHVKPNDIGRAHVKPNDIGGGEVEEGGGRVERGRGGSGGRGDSGTA